MALRPTELPALGVFAVAARHQNFAHAADELHLTASAVSHHVRRLEASLGIALFQRHARGVVLTAEGRALADSANGALADLAAVSAALRRRAREVEHEIVRVTTLHSLAYCWLLPRLPRFAALHPRIRLDVETSHALARFDESGPDLAIRHGAGEWPGLSSVHLMDEQLFPVAAPTLPGLAAVRTAAEVANLPLITDRAHQGWRDWFLAAGVRAVRLPPMHSFADSTDAMRAAAVGLGAALARTAIAAPYLASGELVRLPGPALAARFAYWLVHPAHRRPRAATAAFVAWLRHEAAASARGD